MSVRRGVLSMAVLSAFCLQGYAAMAQEPKRIPSGHSYSPKHQRLPRLNSRQDRINGQADIYQSEIYRSQRDTAVSFSNSRIFGNNGLLTPGSSNRPHY